MDPQTKAQSTVPSSAACFVVTLSCFLWITAITVAITHFLDLDALTGCMIGLSLALTTGVAVLLILYELRHAIDLPDDVELREFEGIGFSVILGSPVLAPAGAAPDPFHMFF